MLGTIVLVGSRGAKSNLLVMPKPVEDRAAIIDRYGALKTRVLQFKPVQDEYEALGKHIQSWYAAEPADKSFAESGTSYTVQISQRSTERIIDVSRVYAAVGKRKFLQSCGFTLKALTALFTGEEIPGFVSEHQSGSRRLAVLPVERKEAA